MDRVLSSAELKANAFDLVSELRKYSASQKEIWRKVPFLALQADGITGYSDTYSRAYQQGYWALSESIVDGRYQVYVDLATGELVSAGRPDRPANDSSVLVFALNPAVLDAAKIIQDLIAHAQRPYWHTYTKETQEQWRQKLIERYGLLELYERKHHTHENMPEWVVDMSG